MSDLNVAKNSATVWPSFWYWDKNCCIISSYVVSVQKIRNHIIICSNRVKQKFSAVSLIAFDTLHFNIIIEPGHVVTKWSKLGSKPTVGIHTFEALSFDKQFGNSCFWNSINFVNCWASDMKNVFLVLFLVWKCIVAVLKRMLVTLYWKVFSSSTSICCIKMNV